ncbi:MAG TPA: DUF4118 domain-containing protein [Candidatus Polarisedimenticolia bacterium]|nr:DUF4118 domain-containing protein [Candidatus Polarisedimenticolia bacterium]
MRTDPARLFAPAAGPFAAILLGMALVPLREATSAANFIFAFLIVIIVAAEFGGRWAALVTAACSALSLDFFLTRPYLSLRIEAKHDLIAFIGLTLCGLVVAAFGSRRSDAATRLLEARTHLDLLREAVALLEPGRLWRNSAEEFLAMCRERLPVAGLALRDAAGTIVATSGRAVPPRADPTDEVRPDTLLPAGAGLPDDSRAGRPIPTAGVFLPLVHGGRPVGRLEIWGDRTPATASARQELSDLGRVLAVLLDRSDRN